MTKPAPRHMTTIQMRDEGTVIHSYNDEPAWIDLVGNKFWYSYGKIHRETGPALIDPNGGFAWIYQGNEVSFDEWCEMTGKTDEEKTLSKLEYM